MARSDYVLSFPRTVPGMAHQRRIQLTREGLYYLCVVTAILAGAVSRQLNLLMLLGSVLAGPLVFSMLYGRRMLRRLEVARSLPPQLSVGMTLRVDLSITSRHRWLRLWMVEVRDRLAREERGDAKGESTRVGVFFPTIAAGETKLGWYDGRLTRRGVYRFGPLCVTSRFPLGLVRHTLVIDDCRSLIVHPKLGTLERDLAKEVREDSGSNQRRARRGIQQSDFYGLRDWRSGDSLRLIHWRTSARRGSLVVREFDERQVRDLAVIVDLWQPARPGEEHLAAVETAVSFAATVIVESLRDRGRTLQLHLIAHEPVDRSGSATGPFARELLDQLSIASPHAVPAAETDLAEVLSSLPDGGATLLISTRPIDLDTLESSGQGNLRINAGRLHCVDVTSGQLAKYFHV
jgi:uncharacterized protein (DUF58 family)